MNYAKRLVRGMRHGEKGFTLIELLIVIAILGVIAAVVGLNLGGFVGRGNLEAAQTELHQAQTAVIACLADAGAAELDSDPGAWNGGATGSPQATVPGGTDVKKASDYLTGGTFKATYDFDKSGTLVSATNVSWSGIDWDGDNLRWKKAAAV